MALLLRAISADIFVSEADTAERGSAYRGFKEFRLRGRALDISEIVAAAALLAGLLLRAVLFPAHPNLWEDEIIAATHAVQPLGALLVNVVRNDIHPPLYFLQLHIWALASAADSWLLLNSVLWSVAEIASLYVVARRLGGGRQLALTAAALLALLPTALTIAFSLRMYAMLSTMVIWAVAFAHDGFAQRRPRALLWLGLLCLAIVYTHAIGFVAVLFIALYGLMLMRREAAGWQAYRDWLLLFATLAVLALPMLASDMLHDANLAGLGDFATVPHWIAGAVLGGYGTLPTAIGVLLFAILATAGLVQPRTRPLALCFIVAPLALAIGVSLAVKPIYKADFFSSLMSPFVALTLAALAVELRSAWLRTTAVAALSVLLGTIAVRAGGLSLKSTDFPALTRVLRAEARPGDVVYVPQMAMFWGVAWNLGGPHWGSPLQIAARPNRQWRAVYLRLGPRAVKALDLEPQRQDVVLHRLDVVTGRRLPAARNGRLWVVAYPRADLPGGTLAPRHDGLPRRRTWRFGADHKLLLMLYAKP